MDHLREMECLTSPVVKRADEILLYRGVAVCFRLAGTLFSADNWTSRMCFHRGVKTFRPVPGQAQNWVRTVRQWSTHSSSPPLAWSPLCW